jgi:hypothetical protein
MNGKESIEREFGELLFETSVANISWYHAGLKVSSSETASSFQSLKSSSRQSTKLRYKKPNTENPTQNS